MDEELSGRYSTPELSVRWTSVSAYELDLEPEPTEKRMAADDPELVLPAGLAVIGAVSSGLLLSHIRHLQSNQPRLPV